MSTYRVYGRMNGKRYSLQEIEKQGHDLTLFIQGRNEVLLNLDETAIRAYYAKWGVLCPVESLVFWTGIHKARVQIAALPEEEKVISLVWLAEHGFSAEI